MGHSNPCRTYPQGYFSFTPKGSHCSRPKCRNTHTTQATPIPVLSFDQRDPYNTLVPSPYNCLQAPKRLVPCHICKCLNPRYENLFFGVALTISAMMSTFVFIKVPKHGLTCAKSCFSKETSFSEFRMLSFSLPKAFEKADLFVGETCFDRPPFDAKSREWCRYQVCRHHGHEVRIMNLRSWSCVGRRAFINNLEKT